jgi:hypothetical protein
MERWIVIGRWSRVDGNQGDGFADIEEAAHDLEK